MPGTAQTAGRGARALGTPPHPSSREEKKGQPPTDCEQVGPGRWPGQAGGRENKAPEKGAAPAPDPSLWATGLRTRKANH